MPQKYNKKCKTNNILQVQKARTANVIQNEAVEMRDTPQEMIEEMEIMQGKLVIGLTVETNTPEEKYVALFI